MVIKQIYKTLFLMVAFCMVFTCTVVLSGNVALADGDMGVVGAMVVSRPLNTGAGDCYRAVANVQAGDEVHVLARNEAATWVFVWSPDGDGWVPVSAVTGVDIASLPVWTDHFVGESCHDDDHHHAPNGRMTQNMPIREGAAACYATIDYVSAGLEVVVLARNAAGTWLFIWTPLGDGWVWAGSVDYDGDINDLPVWADHFEGSVCSPENAEASC